MIYFIYRMKTQNSDMDIKESLFYQNGLPIKRPNDIDLLNLSQNISINISSKTNSDRSYHLQSMDFALIGSLQNSSETISFKQQQKSVTKNKTQIVTQAKNQKLHALTEQNNDLQNMLNGCRELNGLHVTGRAIHSQKTPSIIKR